MFQIRELKEEWLVVFEYICDKNNEADIFTKIADAIALHRHTKKFCKDDGLSKKLKDKIS
jgi:hypothetical protein